MERTTTKKAVIAAAFVLTLLIFLFALFSGAQSGPAGILQNIPNTTPWLILFLISCLAIRYTFLGGILMILFGAFLVGFFNVLSGNWAAFYFFILPICALGVALVGVGRGKRKVV